MATGPTALTRDPRTTERVRRHERAIAKVQRAYAALPPDEPVRLAKRTSNLFRPRRTAGASGLDLSAMQGVIELDPVTCTARVGGLTTYEQLVDELLPHADPHR